MQMGIAFEESQNDFKKQKNKTRPDPKAFQKH